MNVKKVQVNLGSITTPMQSEGVKVLKT